MTERFLVPLILILLATGAASAAAPAWASAPVVASADLVVLFHESARHAAGPDATRFDLEADRVVVRVTGSAHAMTGAPFPHVSTHTQPVTQEPMHFQDVKASAATFRSDAVFALTPERTATPLAYAFTGVTGDGVTAEGAGEVRASAGRWAERPTEAFRHDVPDAHVRLATGAGVHVVEGTFTLYVWDVDFEVIGNAGRDVFRTGVRGGTDALAAHVERWAWAEILVENGRLVVTTGDAFHAHARHVTAAGDSERARFTTQDGGLVATTLLAPGASAPAAPDAAGERTQLVALLALALALPGLAGAVLAARLKRRGRAPPSLPERVGPGVDAFLVNGARALQSGDAAVAVKWFDCALALDERLWVAHFSRALALHALGEHVDAHAALLRAAAADPERAVVQYHLALSWLAGGKPGAALDALARAVHRDPGFAAVARADAAFVDAFGDHPRFLALTGAL